MALVLVLEETVKVKSLSALSENLWILKTSVVSPCRTSPCQLKGPTCSLDGSDSVPWISLVPSPDCFTVLPHFVCMSVFRHGNQKYQGAGVIWHDIFYFVLCSFSYNS